MGYRLVEIFSKELIDNQYSLIIECNEYDYNTDKKIQQLSRSPFTFPSDMTDVQIVDSVKNNEYSIYF